MVRSTTLHGHDIVLRRASAYDDLRKALADLDYVIEEAPSNAQIVEALRRIRREAVLHMSDASWQQRQFT